MSNVIKLRPASEPDEVLGEAEGAFASCAVIGWNHDGDFEARMSANVSEAMLIAMMRLFEAQLIAYMLDDE